MRNKEKSDAEMEPDSVVKTFNNAVRSKIGIEHVDYVKADLPCWFINRGRRQWEEYHQLRESLFEYILTYFPNSYLLWDGTANPSILKGDWTELSDMEWLIPQNATPKELHEVIREGDWNIYKPVKGRITSFRGYDMGNYKHLVKLMKDFSLLFTLTSLHDNDPWIFIINPETILLSKDKKNDY